MSAICATGATQALKDVDRIIRDRKAGVNFFIEIRGKTPYDYIHFVCVPLVRSELRILKLRFHEVLSFSRNFLAPCVFFYFEEEFVKGIVYGKKRTSFILPIEDFFLYMDSGLLDGFSNANFQKIKVFHDRSAYLYSKYHKLYLPADAYCIDVDCFANRTVYEIKRKEEDLTYNQKVFSSILKGSPYSYKVLRV